MFAKILLIIISLLLISNPFSVKAEKPQKRLFKNIPYEPGLVVSTDSRTTTSNNLPISNPISYPPTRQNTNSNQPDRLIKNEPTTQQKTAKPSKVNPHQDPAPPTTNRSWFVDHASKQWHIEDNLWMSHE